MKILITGGCGYIGTHITRVLSHQHHVAVYDNITYEPHYLDPYEFYFGDITDYERFEEVLNDFKPDVVINTAALVGDAACQVNPLRTKDVNQDAVKWLCDNFDGKIIQLSTCSVYGINNNLISEESPTNPISVYAETKLASEEYVLKKKGGLVFRLGTIYGMSGGRPRLDLVVNIFATLAALGHPLRITGKEAWRPLLHVKDVCTGVKLGLDRNLSGVYNLAERNWQIGKLAEEVGRFTCYPEVIYEDIKAEDLRNYKVSTDKITTAGFIPRHSLRDGVKEMYDTIRQKRIKDPFAEIYHNGKFILDLESKA